MSSRSQTGSKSATERWIAAADTDSRWALGDGELVTQLGHALFELTGPLVELGHALGGHVAPRGPGRAWPSRVMPGAASLEDVDRAAVRGLVVGLAALQCLAMRCPHSGPDRDGVAESPNAFNPPLRPVWLPSTQGFLSGHGAQGMFGHLHRSESSHPYT